MTERLTILEGPMRCDSFGHAGRTGLGKTSTLVHLARDTTEKHGHGAVLALQPYTNTRDGGWLMGANGDRWRAQWLASPSLVHFALEHPDLRLIIIDEAHLWINQEVELLRLILKASGLGIDVWLSGIRFNHMNQEFSWWPVISPYAKTIHHLTAPCQCGRRATHVFRHGLSEASVQVDCAATLYESVCLTCWEICDSARQERKKRKP